jgi:CelD/BcsL family acetyltransferase involved in cellulose biosynthesis
VTVIDLPQRGRPARMPFKVELFSGDDLLAADWPSIADGRDLKMRDLKMYVFQSREFLEVWLDTIGKAARIESHLVVVKDDAGRPILYLPLAIETKFNVRLLRFMDCGVVDYNAPILAAGYAPSRQEFQTLWAEILSRLPGFDVVDLNKIAADVEGARNPLMHLHCTPDSESGHAMALAGLRDDPAATRRPLARRQRKLAHSANELSKTGTCSFVVNPAGPELERMADRLFALKREKYRRSATPDFLAMPGIEQFYRAMLSPGRLGRIGHLAALTVGDTMAAAHLGFIGRGRFHYIMPAYDTAFGRYSVGHLLLQHLIDRAAAQNFDTFDLGVGDMSYKDSWTTHHLALHVHERAMTAAGRLYLQMRRVRRFVKASGVRTWFRTAS